MRIDFGAFFGLVIGVSAAISQADTPRKASSSGLDSLEKAADRRAVESGPRSQREDYAELIREATRFAGAVAKDDNAAFAMLAPAAVQNALLARRGARIAPITTFTPERMDIPKVGVPQNIAVWEDPVMQKNYRSLMEAASSASAELFPITGPPTVSRIVGPGTQDVPESGFNDCVAVGRRVGTQDQFCCTGTLIGRNVVVTAGHCFFCIGGGANNAVVYVGGDIGTPGKRITGTATRHPQYDQDGHPNDLAVIVLTSPFDGVTPRGIATEAQIDAATFVRAVGFGNSDFASTEGFGVKRMVDVPIASSDCGTDDAVGRFGCDKELEMVAGFVGLGPDSCNGDSGGPVYVLVGDDARNETSWLLAGATSRATVLATRPCGDGGIYVRIDKYLEFIRSIPGVEF